jgi:iron complex transport system substrate-binding protein
MRRSVSVLTLAVALAGSACGDTAQSLPTTAVTAAPSATTATRVTTTPATSVAVEAPIELTSEAGVVVLDTPAERIAALSAAHVEMLYAMDAGDRVIAGDLFSDYPPETERLVRLDSFNLSVEAVIDLDPDR